MSASAHDWDAGLAAACRAPRPIADDVTMLIPTLGRSSLSICLGHMLAGTVWPAGLIVVDQGSSEQIAQWLRDLRALGIDARHEPCTGRGRALGLNVGLRLVTTRFVVITDDDCIPDAYWIERYDTYLRQQPSFVFTGQVAAAGTERVISTVSGLVPSTSRKPGWSFDRLSGGNCGMAIAVLRQVGLFDEDPCMRFAEDGEWAYRALRAGVAIVYAPDLVVAHTGWRELDERLAQYRDYALSHGAFFGKHLRRGDFFIALRASIHLARAMRRWLRGVLSGDAELAANGRSYMIHLIPGVMAGAKSRIEPPLLS